MNYEKAYKEALERAEGIIKYYKERNRDEASIEDLETIFPELIESEDERIRKGLITFLTGFKEELGNPPAFCNVSTDEAIAWLEKQGEQKPADMVEPKFHEGDWVVWQDKCYKVNYNGCGYELIDQNGLSTSLEYGTVDTSAHLWDISDAKDGDVLYSPCLSLLWIFKSRDTVYCGCNLNYDGVFCGEGYFERPNDAIPATREQCDTLFAKMHEAGYEWDAKEKELKKIERKPAWSEEDEKIALSIEQVMNCASLLNIVPDKIERIRAWLKSVKQRIGG